MTWEQQNLDATALTITLRAGLCWGTLMAVDDTEILWEVE